MLQKHGVALSDARILELYAAAESDVQKGTFVRYREVLRRVVRGLGDRLGFAPSAAELDCLSDSIRDWMPFADTVGALRALKKSFKLAIISNIDDDLFAGSASRLGVHFDWVITAEQVGSYKPSARNFEFAIERMGLPRERLLHVAQSVYHDIVPAKALGLSTVWVNRRSGKAGGGATLIARGQPDLEVPDLQSLVTLMGLGPG